MAKKSTSSTTSTTTSRSRKPETTGAVAADTAVTTPTAATATKSVKPRQTSVPPKSRAAQTAAPADGAAAGAKPSLTVTDEMIRQRAFEMWQQGVPGSEHDHWLAAERELRNGR